MQRINRLSLLAVLVCGVAGCIRSEDLVGEWKGTNANDDTWTISRRADGTFSMTMVTDGSTIDAEGRYYVLGSTHIYCYTKSSDATWELGRRWYETVVLLTPSEFRSRSQEDGLVSVERRVEDD